MNIEIQELKEEFNSQKSLAVEIIQDLKKELKIFHILCVIELILFLISIVLYVLK